MKEKSAFYRIAIVLVLMTTLSCASPIQKLAKDLSIPSECIEAYSLFNKYLVLEEDGFFHYREGLKNPNKKVTDLFLDNLRCWQSYITEEELVSVIGHPQVVINHDPNDKLVIYRIKTPQCSGDINSSWEKNCGIIGLRVDKNGKLKPGSKFFLPLK